MATTNPLSSTPISQQDYEQHLRALLCLTPLRTVQWVNLARHHVRLASLTR
jgi:hypothetical protein